MLNVGGKYIYHRDLMGYKVLTNFCKY